MVADVIETQFDGPVALVRLDRPKQFNAFNSLLRRRLLETANEIEARGDVRVVILSGSGPGFCAGADLREGLSDPVSRQIEEEYRPPLEAIAESSKIWIAQVHGTAAGIGAAFAMNCDFVTMADDASIYMAFAAIGLVPDGGNTWLLLQRMGYARALQAILEGRKIPAAECLELGIANKLFAPGDLEAGTRAWAQELAKGAPLAMAAAKRVLRQASSMRFGETISAEAGEQDRLTKSRDFAQAVAAFFNREKPVFRGE
jgi:2-(1,2-epoxy-1,2-dihydrophenyl)acetyl-CoA isomerase